MASILQRDRIGQDQGGGLGGAVRGISQAGPRPQLPALRVPGQDQGASTDELRRMGVNPAPRSASSPPSALMTPGVGGPAIPPPGGMAGGPAITPPGPTAPAAPPGPDINPMQQRVQVPQMQPQSSQPGTAIDPNDSLRSRAFLPPEDVSFDPATQRARELVSGGLEGLQGPDRGQLAMDAFQRFQEQGEPQFQQRLQDVGRRAAALGRVGAGMTTSDLGDVTTRREQELTREQGRLSGEAAGLTLQDRLAAQSGLESGAGTLAGLGGEEFNRGIQQRGELRGERGYQGDLAERAQQARVSQEQAEFDRQQTETENKLREQQILSGLVQGSPYSPYAGLQGASQLGGGDNPADYFSLLAQQGGGGAQPQAPVSAPPGGFGGQVPGIFQGESLGRRRYGVQ